MGEARSTARDAVVRPLSRVAVRPCARPGCPSPARATLSFRYATREAWLEALHDESSPATYDLCSSHADRTRPPTGWGIVDQRPVEDQEPAERAPARELGDEHTVAVLAAALRAVPDRPAAAPPEVAEVDEDIDLLAPAEPEADLLAPAEPEADLLAPAEPEAELHDGLAGPDELPDGLRDGIEDALAELAAVARGDLDAEQIAIELDDPAEDDDAGDIAPPAAPVGTPVPRPVRAARERLAEDGPGGPARAW